MAGVMTGETHMLGTLDLGTMIAMAVPFIVALGIGIAAVCWVRTRNR
ncbi:hypothetical protein GCM10010346_06470 [Streptomyces chryseus]|uniref:Uncharacterized protein n=1 Tax=Streptomyces chryseus TaxID=68186 RepID=A0ABQ3DF38_9ACTN|nr:hypothetical protein GCM10010346_06470 [Streptomyces chryseus]